jgi:hypothetical protein
VEPTTDPKIDHFMQPKITGYRQLGPTETALMNEAKAIGAQMQDLVNRLRDYHKAQREAAEDLNPPLQTERLRLIDAEPERWLAMGRTDIQTGVMKIVRSIAQPAS